MALINDRLVEYAAHERWETGIYPKIAMSLAIVKPTPQLPAKGKASLAGPSYVIDTPNDEPLTLDRQPLIPRWKDLAHEILAMIIGWTMYGGLLVDWAANTDVSWANLQLGHQTKVLFPRMILACKDFYDMALTQFFKNNIFAFTNIVSFNLFKALKLTNFPAHYDKIKWMNIVAWNSPRSFLRHGLIDVGAQVKELCIDMVGPFMRDIPRIRDEEDAWFEAIIKKLHLLRFPPSLRLIRMAGFPDCAMREKFVDLLESKLVPYAKVQLEPAILGLKDTGTSIIITTEPD